MDNQNSNPTGDAPVVPATPVTDTQTPAAPMDQPVMDPAVPVSTETTPVDAPTAPAANTTCPQCQGVEGCVCPTTPSV